MTMVKPQTWQRNTANARSCVPWWLWLTFDLDGGRREPPLLESREAAQHDRHAQQVESGYRRTVAVAVIAWRREPLWLAAPCRTAFRLGPWARCPAWSTDPIHSCASCTEACAKACIAKRNTGRATPTPSVVACILGGKACLYARLLNPSNPNRPRTRGDLPLHPTTGTRDHSRRSLVLRPALEFQHGQGSGAIADSLTCRRFRIAV